MSKFLESITRRMVAVQSAISSSDEKVAASATDEAHGAYGSNKSQRKYEVFDSYFSKPATKDRIEYGDSLATAVAKLCDGEVSALSVIKQSLDKGAEIDPDSALGAISGMLSFDSNRLYGKDIWLLHSNVCEADITKTLAVLRGAQLGLIPQSAIHAAIQGEPLDVNDVLSKVQQRLPAFGQNDSVSPPKI